MPITQTRMLGLIKSALAYKNAFENLEAYSQALSRQVQDGQTTTGEALASLTSAFLAERPKSQAASIIMVEEYHFRKFEHRNEREKERMTQRRRAAGQGPAAEPQRRRPSYKPALTEADLTDLLNRNYGESEDALKPEDLDDGVIK